MLCKLELYQMIRKIEQKSNLDGEQNICVFVDLLGSFSIQDGRVYNGNVWNVCIFEVIPFHSCLDFTK